MQIINVLVFQQAAEQKHRRHSQGAGAVSGHLYKLRGTFSQVHEADGLAPT